MVSRISQGSCGRTEVCMVTCGTRRGLRTVLEAGSYSENNTRLPEVVLSVALLEIRLGLIIKTQNASTGCAGRATTLGKTAECNEQGLGLQNLRVACLCLFSSRKEAQALGGQIWSSLHVPVLLLHSSLEGRSGVRSTSLEERGLH